jgi:hypothetical protein
MLAYWFTTHEHGSFPIERYPLSPRIQMLRQILARFGEVAWRGGS